MELVEGRSLDHVISSPPPAARAVELLRQMAAGLAALHARGVIHRDFKPSNVLVTTDSEGRKPSS